MKTRDEFFAFDDRLAKLGEPPLSTWWKHEVGRFLDGYDSGDATELWAAAGRGGSKSTTAYKLATFLTLFGSFSIPPAQRHYANIISRQRDEAGKAIQVISRWLVALGVPHRPVGDVIELDAMNRGIRVSTATVGGASGWRSFFVCADEYAKWPTEGVAIADAEEVLASARAMTATHPRAVLVVCSTPWLDSGMFYTAITAGDGDGRSVAGPAPSWIANPDLQTEEQTRRRERNPRIWAREYACQFSSEYSDGFFPSEAVAAATDKGRSPVPPHPRVERGHVLTIDPAFSGDSFGICLAHPELAGQTPMVVVDYMAAMSPPRGGQLSPDACVHTVVALRRAFPGEMYVRSDQHSAETLKEVFSRKGALLFVEPWSLQSKLQRYTLVRQLLIDRLLRLPDDPALRREMSAVCLRMTPNGTETITTRSGSDDRVSALVHAVYTAYRQSPAYGRSTSVDNLPVLVRHDVPTVHTISGASGGARSWGRSIG